MNVGLLWTSLGLSWVAWMTAPLAWVDGKQSALWIRSFSAVMVWASFILSAIAFWRMNGCAL